MYKIQSGNYGEIFLYNNNILKKYINKSFIFTDFLIEINCLKILNENKYIVKYINHYYNNGFHYIEMEKYEDNLNDYAFKLNFNERYNLFPILFNDILNGLNYIHSYGIIHNDIKPNNILVKKNRFVICDFGIADFDFNCFKKRRSCGTYVTTSPEVLLNLSTDKDTFFKNDIWSVGMTLFYFLFKYYLFCKNNNFDNLNNLIKSMALDCNLSIDKFKESIKYYKLNSSINILKQYQNSIPKKYSLILSKMLKYNPNERYSIDKLLTLFNDIKNVNIEMNNLYIFDYSLISKNDKYNIFNIIKTNNNLVNILSYEIALRYFSKKNKISNTYKKINLIVEIFLKEKSKINFDQDILDILSHIDYLIYNPFLHKSIINSFKYNIILDNYIYINEIFDWIK